LNLQNQLKVQSILTLLSHMEVMLGRYMKW